MIPANGLNFENWITASQRFGEQTEEINGMGNK